MKKVTVLRLYATIDYCVWLKDIKYEDIPKCCNMKKGYNYYLFLMYDNDQIRIIKINKDSTPKEEKRFHELYNKYKRYKRK